MFHYKGKQALLATLLTFPVVSHIYLEKNLKNSKSLWLASKHLTLLSVSYIKPEVSIHWHFYLCYYNFRILHHMYSFKFQEFREVKFFEWVSYTTRTIILIKSFLTKKYFRRKKNTCFKEYKPLFLLFIIVRKKTQDLSKKIFLKSVQFLVCLSWHIFVTVATWASMSSFCYNSAF